MEEIESKLKGLGLRLPPAKAHVANYLGSKKSGSTLYVSARVSELRGVVGADIDLIQANQAARDTLMLILAIVNKDIGSLDHIDSITKMVGYVRSSDDFEKQPLVIDGASDLLIALWGEQGRHARTATGSSQLPLRAAVQLELIMQLKSD